MLTTRGWWFLIVVLALLAIGAFWIPYFTVVPAILAATLLVWFVYEWVLFHTKSNAAVARLRVRRWVLQGGRPTPMLWAGHPFEVRVRVEHNGLVTVEYAVVEDRLPAGADVLEGDPERVTALRSGEPCDVVYTLRCPAAGVLRFEGVKVRVADLNGFFYRRVFLRDPVEFLVLPPLVNDEGRQRANKRFNNLPPPGIHRLRRPGSGDELLDLRDYRPGDPPKMIAWKASARKDKLITKEFENDVPVRCVLFLDTSDGVRLGPPGNTLLTRMAGIAAVVSQASAANRDLVGLTTFDDEGATRSKTARTQTHMIQVLRQLAEVSALQPGTHGVPLDALIGRAHPLAHELYPEVMKRSSNSVPLGRSWLPLLDKWWGWVILFFVVFPPCLLAFFLSGVLDPGSVPLPGWLRKIYASWLGGTLEVAVKILRNRGMSLESRLVLFVVVWFALLNLLSFIAGLFWLIYGARGWVGSRRADLITRKQLAQLFAMQDGTGPDGIERYIHDDEEFGKRIGAFLAHHQLRVPMPLYDDYGRYRFRCPRKAEVLAGEIVRAIARARDNELYVILADLTELGEDLEPLVKACRAARARKHHVLVIVPWPADLPSPDEAPPPPPDPEGKKRRRHPDDLDDRARARRISKIVLENMTKKYQDQFRAIRRALAHVGATVMRADDGDPVRLVLDRLDRLRGMRTRR